MAGQLPLARGRAGTGVEGRAGGGGTLPPAGGRPAAFFPTWPPILRPTPGPPSLSLSLSLSPSLSLSLSLSLSVSLSLSLSLSFLLTTSPHTLSRNILSLPLQVVDHYENPRNVGSFDKADPNVGTGLVGAPACGDVMKLQLKVDDDGNVVDAVFKTFGCGSAIASSSVATEWVKGRTLDDVTTIKNTDIARHLSLPPVKLHCSMLAEDAIKAAVKDVLAKRAAAKAAA